MPKNRQHIPRDERTGDLLHAARSLFVANGYVSTTIADISAAVGVARANIYWYWDSKDDIFASVMNQILDEEISALNRATADMTPYEQLIVGLRQMYPFRPLHRAMHERLSYSTAVQGAHDMFLTWVRDLVIQTVGESVGDVDTALAADVVVAAFEGSHTESSNRPAHEMIPFMLDAILAAGGRGLPVATAPDPHLR